MTSCAVANRDFYNTTADAIYTVISPPIFFVAFSTPSREVHLHLAITLRQGKTMVDHGKMNF